MAVPSVLLVDRGEHRAVCLDEEAYQALQRMVDEVLENPVAAGETLDTSAFEELSQRLNVAEESEPDKAEKVGKINLSPASGHSLEILREHARVLAGFEQDGRLRERLTCKACGKVMLVNPALEERRRERKAQAEKGAGAASALGSIASFDISHPYLSTFAILANMDGEDGSEEVSDELVCDQCQGIEFDHALVAFCPQCHSLRDETILLSCPQCGCDFRTMVEDDADFWETAPEASSRFRELVNKSMLVDKFDEFENNLWAGQKEALLKPLTGDERLICMCRCAVHDDIGRYVALLLTSRQVIWVRKTPFSFATSGRFEWREVAKVANADGGLQFVTRSGDRSPVFDDFRGVGVMLSDQHVIFDLSGIRHIIEQLRRKSAAKSN